MKSVIYPNDCRRNTNTGCASCFSQKCKSEDSMGEICIILWALLPFDLFLHHSLEALTEPKQVFSPENRRVHSHPHNCTDFAHGIFGFTGARICVKFRLPFLSESSRKLFGREPLETQLLNPMALFLNLLAHFSRTWACFS